MQILFRRRNHKEEHFERLFSEMYPRLVRFATTLMDNTEEAKDIVSETMEQAWKAVSYTHRALQKILAGKRWRDILLY